MREEEVQLILDRLGCESCALQARFEAPVAAIGVRYCVVDDVLPGPLARRISAAFPGAEKMRLMNSFRERKYTSKNFDDFDPLLAGAVAALDVRAVSEAGAGKHAARCVCHAGQRNHRVHAGRFDPRDQLSVGAVPVRLVCDVSAHGLRTPCPPAGALGASGARTQTCATGY
jgi:hypothetical protein